MKQIKFFLGCALVCFANVVSSCADVIIYPSYDFVMPQMPSAWIEVLGPPSWHLEWITSDGGTARADIAADTAVYSGADIMQGWTSPVIAYPYWPEKNIAVYTMKPAGAIFPLDAMDGSLKLSWRAGVDAFFYRELSAAHNAKRLPHTFNWHSFRALWSADALPEEILKDPWLADWKSIAQKTAASGFDKRRISAAKKESLHLSLPAEGPWISSSPFMEAKAWPGGMAVYLPASAESEAYFCPTGALHYTQKVWVWRAF